MLSGHLAFAVPQPIYSYRTHWKLASVTVRISRGSRKGYSIWHLWQNMVVNVSAFALPLTCHCWGWMKLGAPSSYKFAHHHSWVGLQGFPVRLSIVHSFCSFSMPVVECCSLTWLICSSCIYCATPAMSSALLIEWGLFPCLDIDDRMGNVPSHVIADSDDDNLCCWWGSRPPQESQVCFEATAQVERLLPFLPPPCTAHPHDHWC